MRACPDCGEPEVRVVWKGRAIVNLEPTSSRCVDCLPRWVRTQVQTNVTPILDYKLAQAGDVE